MTPITPRGGSTEGRQFCAFISYLERLHRHNGSMGQARPACKGDQAAIRRRVADGQQKKNSERDIDSQHHLIRIVGLLRMHHRCDQWIDTGHKEQPYQSQQNLQRTFSIHGNTSSTCCSVLSYERAIPVN
jgi:hypothetical protein